MKQIVNNDLEPFLGEGSLPLVVDFSAAWCSPCRIMTDRLDGLEKIYDGRVNFVYCDVEENPDIAEQYKIRNVPTLLFFKNGELINKLSGSVGTELIEENIVHQLA